MDKQKTLDGVYFTFHETLFNTWTGNLNTSGFALSWKVFENLKFSNANNWNVVTANRTEMRIQFGPSVHSKFLIRLYNDDCATRKRASRFCSFSSESKIRSSEMPLFHLQVLAFFEPTAADETLCTLKSIVYGFSCFSKN